MIKRIKKANYIPIQNIEAIFIDEEDLHFYVNSADNKNQYYVTCKNNLWRCDCQDFTVNGLNNDCGAFNCKHIIAVLLFLAQKVEDSVQEVHELGEMVV